MDAVGTPPRSLGLGFDVWTSGRLSAYLVGETGVVIAPGWVRALLAAERYRCCRPKHTLGHLRHAGEVAAGEAELARVGGKGGRGAGQV